MKAPQALAMIAVLIAAAGCTQEPTAPTEMLGDGSSYSGFGLGSGNYLGTAAEDGGFDLGSGSYLGTAENDGGYGVGSGNFTGESTTDEASNPVVETDSASARGGLGMGSGN